ncbi:MAG TPA: peroxiredoxin [Pirellulales bacterium]|nr:peroxiredoxin [Pirellulales bacterium]
MTMYLRLLTTLSVLVASATSLTAADLKPGDPAPAFSLKGSDGKTHSLDDFKGKKVVVIAWFPKAFTGGCTKECKSMRDDGKELRKYEVAYFTASVDEPQKNKEFAESLGLDFPILSDPEKDVAKEYGVLRPDGGVTNRWTFYIGKNGKVLYVDKSVNTAEHGKDIAKKLDELGVEKK